MITSNKVQMKRLVRINAKTHLELFSEFDYSILFWNQ